MECGRGGVVGVGASGGVWMGVWTSFALPPATLSTSPTGPGPGTGMGLCGGATARSGTWFHGGCGRLWEVVVVVEVVVGGGMVGIM